LADAGAEKHVREIIDNGEFTFENEHYQVIQNSKPSSEKKTDFYVLARKIKDNTEREFKISYKKPDFSFVENKVQPHRIPYIYSENWSEILKVQIKPIQHLFNAESIIDFIKEKIKIGWRYEIEQLDAPGIGGRNLSTVIQQNISSQVLWGDGCADKMRDALVDGKKITNSGIPDFILIKEPENIKTIQDVFDDLHDIRKYAKKHWKMRAGFIAQNNRWNRQTKTWKTEGFSRSFAVWVKWDVVNQCLRGRPVYNKPLEKSAGDIIENLSSCLEEMGISHDSNFSFEMLRGRVCDDTVIRL